MGSELCIRDRPCVPQVMPSRGTEEQAGGRGGETPPVNTVDVSARQSRPPESGGEVGRRMEAALRVLDAELCSARSVERSSPGETLSFVVGSEQHARLTRALDELNIICQELR